MTMLTKHAQRRVDQRGISSILLNLLMYFGESHGVKGGAETINFGTRKERQRFAKALRKIADKIERDSSVYTIVNGEAVITCGYQYKRRH